MRGQLRPKLMIQCKVVLERGWIGMATVKKRIKKTKMGEQQDGVPGTEGHPSRLGARPHIPELKSLPASFGVGGHT